MAKYIDAEKLKYEIERRKLSNYYTDTDDYEAELFEIIGSLQQEQPEEPVNDGLKEAAEKYTYGDISDGLKSYVKPVGDEIIKNFIAGAEWQKEQMMKEAVEGYVNYYEDSGGILMAEAQVGCPYHNGDKVRIIIVKE